jgi:type I restriction enzyme, S subunit
MDADLFLQHFGHLAQGDGGIKKLRDVILQLAVHGKLVEQNPADEPVELLLKKIEGEKKRLINEGTVKEIKTPPSKADAILPHGWRWVKLADVAYPQAGFAFKSGGFNEANIGMPLIRIRDVGTSRARPQ